MNRMKIKVIFWLVLLAVTLVLRLPNLGYADYIGDEHKAFILLSEGESLKDFFLSQRKGPLQFVVSYIPYVLTGDYKNELAQRLPFTLFGIASVFVFYELVKRLTKNVSVAFAAAFLFSVSGFVVGFARIAQYQNLNLFFSFASLYFYLGILGDDKHKLRNSLFGTLMFCLSLFAHWDAVFVLPPITVIFAKYLLDKRFPAREKIKLLALNFVLGCLVLLPFLLPYISYQLNHVANMEYFSRRVQVGDYAAQRYKGLIDLYNPFVTFWFYVVCGLFGALFIKRSWVCVLWFLLNLGVFELAIRKPGTHVYNFIIPLLIVCAIGIVGSLEKLPRALKVVGALVLSVLFLFFVYQSFVIFADHKVEYPWEREKMFGRLTPVYSMSDKLPLFGFPHKRFWKNINSYITSQNNRYGYMTNEDKTVSEFYMDTKYAPERGYYIVGINRPQSFVEDWRMEQYGGELVHTITRQTKYGPEAVVKIYKVDK